MKKLLLLTISIIFLSACKSNGWSDKDVEKAMSTCTGTESQCQCMIKKMEKRFDSYNEMININETKNEDEIMEDFKWMVESAEDCGVDWEDIK